MPWHFDEVFKLLFFSLEYVRELRIFVIIEEKSRFLTNFTPYYEPICKELSHKTACYN
jgi:hypothetical protein